MLKYAHCTNYSVDNKLVIFAIVEENKYIGCLIGDWYKNSSSAFIEYICINEEYRNKKYSNLLLQKFNEWLNDSEIAIFLECSKNHCIKNYWEYKKFNILNFKYIQAPLSDGKRPSYDLYLLCNKKDLTKEALLKFLFDAQKYSMSIKNPNKNKYYIKMCNNLKKHNTLIKDK